MRKFVIFAVLFTIPFFVSAQAPGYALDFDGVDDHVDVGDIEMSAWTDLTVEAWFKTTSTSNQRIISKDQKGIVGCFLIYYTGSAWRFQASTGSGWATASKTTSAPNDGNWHHIAGVVDNTNNSIYLYIDGVLQASAAFASATLDDSKDERVVIGADSDPVSTDFEFLGQIDEVRIWDEALSQSVIQEWMIQEITTSHPNYTGLVSDDLKAYYKMSDGSGANLTDNSANSNTGTLSNMVTSGVGSDWITSEAGLVQNVKLVNNSNTSDVSNGCTITSSSIPSGGNNFVAFGNDNIISNTFITTDVPSTLDSRMERIWYLARGTTTGSTDFKFDYSNAGLANVGSAIDNSSSYKLLYRSSTSGDFSQVTTTATSVTGGVVTFSVADGTLSNGFYTIGHTSMTQPGKALDFDGSTNYVTILDDNTLDLGSTYTIEAWIKPQTFGNGEGIVYKGATGFQLLIAVSGGNGFNFDGKTVTGILTADTWYHVAAVNDNGTRSLYLNGVSQTLTGTANSVVNNTANVLIGNGSSAFFDGIIDELRIWSSVRSSSEISNNMYSPLTGDETGLVAYHRFDYSAGNSIFDFSLNDNNGIVTGTTSWVTSDPYKIWTGSSSTVWNTAANWSPSGVPGGSDDITILGSASNQPTVGSNQQCNNIVIQTDATVTVNNSFTLTVNGDITVKSDASGTGAVINKGTLSVTGTLTFERFSAKDEFHYISSPTSSPSYSVFDNAFDFFQFNTDAGWENLGNSSGNLTNGRGYGIQNADAALFYYFTGTFNSSPVTISVKKGTNSRWNLVGNPFPSPIDVNPGNANSFLNLNAVSNAYITNSIWLWDDPGSMGNYSRADYATYNGTGGTAGGGNNTPNGYVDPCQAFFVERTSGPQNITFNSNMQVSNRGSHFYKPDAPEVKTRIWLGITNSFNDYNEILVGFVENATTGVDPLYDATKAKGNDRLAFYSILDTQDFVIQGLPVLTENTEVLVPLGLDVIESNVHRISVKKFENFPPKTSILLEDLKEGVIVSIIDSSYGFMSDTAMVRDRFILHFIVPEAQTSIDNDITNGDFVNIYSYGNNIYLNCLNKDISGEITIYSLLGEVVYKAELSNVTYDKIKLNQPTGYYIVNIITDNKVFTEKVFIN